MSFMGNGVMGQRVDALRIHYGLADESLTETAGKFRISSSPAR